MLHNADYEPDAAKRADMIKSALRLMAADHVMLPLMQFPKSGFWRTDKVGGPVDAELRNYTSFINNHLWTDLDGDGKVVIGAEQWPECLNPFTECANSSWMVWTTIKPGDAWCVRHHQRRRIRGNQPADGRTNGHPEVSSNVVH